MSQTEKDPGIRLFGREIPVPECLIPAKSGPTDACSRIKKIELAMPSQCEENSVQCENSSDLRDSKQESQHEVQENAPSVKPKRLKDNMEAGGSDEGKLLKKPDQILQCPRCNSLDTKFCYFNNYNVNQPRHFCKNCQRYWTAGGTMRNVPVGAGRRKNKHLPAQYRHIVEISDGIPASTDSSGSQQQHHISSLGSSVPFRSSSDNGTVLKFGPDTPLCESMDSMLNLRDQKRCVDASSMSCGEHGAEPSFRGSSSTSNGTQGNELSERNTSNWLQCYPVPPFVLPYPGWNNVNSMEAVHRQSSAPMCNPYKAGPSAMQWGPTPMVAIPGICPPTIPLHLVQPSYWSGTPPWNGGAGAVSIGSNACLSPSSSTSNSCCSGNGSPTLGKHTRDTVLVDEEKSEKYVLAPKTMRVEAPNEASKNHMRAALVIKHDQQQTVVSNGGVLKKTEAKEGKDRESGASQILEANPAAISLAHAFQESI